MLSIKFIIPHRQVVDFLPQRVDSCVSVLLHLVNSDYLTLEDLGLFEKVLVHSLDLVAFLFVLLFQRDVFLQVHLEVLLLSLQSDD